MIIPSNQDPEYFCCLLVYNYLFFLDPYKIKFKYYSQIFVPKFSFNYQPSHKITNQHHLRVHGSNFILPFRCVAECGQGFYQTAGKCTKCPHTCTACVSRLNCTSCGGALRLQSGTCRATCAPGYYPDDGTCSKCYLSCETCTGPRRDQCASCPPDWRLAAGECRPECPQNFFPWENSCRRCHHYCQDCRGAGPQRCTACPPHFALEGGLCVECLSSQYYEARSRSCRPCHDSCRSCSGPGPTNCVNCAHPLRLDR